MKPGGAAIKQSRARAVVLVGALGGAWATAGCTAQSVEREGPQIEPRDGELPLQGPVEVSRVPAPLPGAHCMVQVEGQGLLDMEDDYLPHVIQCENGGANLEALKAQAISARSVAYYSVETSGSICDSQGCQVYSCGATPQPIHYQAVQETSGLYLNYNGTLTYGFYVAGDNNTSPPACVGVSGSTEGWVTYNEGQSGTNVEQTALGFIHQPGDNGYGQNRGCMSQWGARCLENNNGYDYLGILRFYYGDDIELTQAQGACVLPLPGEGSTGEPPPESTSDASASTSEPGVDASTGIDPDGPPPPADESIGDPTFPGDTGGGGTGPSSAGDATSGVDPALPTTFGEDQESGGCRVDRPEPGAWWLLGLWGLVRRRRRRGG
ncbi:SpoIID/LytB domain-containing protein [Paraliomyxa miuraensis]|uniref:SpoIID/LytB domain-containing protein n=1 Tax=Paraliomyxa miuraensis TaxID=376150 RepID=UPI00225BCC40|nr:SpoIID/LytB domain-containing protein [Paraliomyxa miuraensis]MCX4243400.1 hypothetical protein [Paraliomyxa miuraensis]